jgi:alpha-1,3-rhamnosyl/mannosyltransferase
MRVVMNQLAALGLKTGVGQYAFQLLGGLRAQAGDDQIDAFPRGWLRHVREVGARLRPYLDRGDGAGPAAPAPRRFSLAPVRKAVVRRLRQQGRVWLARSFRKFCSRGGYDLYHEPNFIPLPCDCPTVTTLHDLSAVLHPEWHPADRVAHYEQHFRQAVASCVHFLTVSEFSRQEVLRTLHLPPERVTRVYNGIRPDLGPLPADTVAGTLARLGLPPRYLLCVGTIEPRKNVLLLLRAYCALPHHVRAAWPLVLAGSWGWNAGAVAAYLHDVARHRGVLHLGYLADADLAAAYNGARALVYPSLYEGFGFPPLEMMACGGAVLASTAGALVETVGGQAHLIPADDLDGWRAAMARVVTDDDWWQALRRGAQATARPYTWERCAAETLQVYRSLCGGTADRQEVAGRAGASRLRAAG